MTNMAILYGTIIVAQSDHRACPMKKQAENHNNRAQKLDLGNTDPDAKLTTE